jgi:hypothetical protein
MEGRETREDTILAIHLVAEEVEEAAVTQTWRIRGRRVAAVQAALEQEGKQPAVKAGML